MSDSSLTFKDILDTKMSNLAYSVLAVFEEWNGNTEEDLITEINATVEEYADTIREPLVNMITASVTIVLEEELTSEPAVEEETGVNEFEIKHAKLVDMFANLRDYAFRFRDVEDKTLQKFACTVLTLIAEHTPEENKLPPAEEQTAKANATLLKIRKLVDTNPKNDVKENIKKLIDDAIPGRDTLNDDIFVGVPAPEDVL